MIRIRKFFVVFREGIKIFLDNGCFDKAAAISFYAFFSLIPILLLTTVILGYLLGTQEGLLEHVITMAKQGLPYIGPRIISDLKGLATSWKTLGWVSIVLVILTAEFVLNVTSEALQEVFGVPKRYGFFKKKVINAFILIIPALAGFVSLTITTLAKVFTASKFLILGFDISYYVQSLMITYVLPFFIMVLAVSVVYWILSGPNLNFDYSFYGSLIFATLWEVSKHFFAIYISYVPTYNKFYGSIGTVMILLLYIFFTACIFLFSAAVARAAYRGKNEAYPWVTTLKEKKS